jgi:transcription antitermination factor NusG
MSTQWFIAITLVAKEKVAKAHLDSKQFTTYLPMYRRMEIGKKKEPKPLFPGYLFFQADLENPERRWAEVYSANGIRDVLPPDRRPQLVPGWIIDELQSRERDGLIHLPPRSQLKAVKGSKVRVKGSGLEAVFEEAVDTNRAIILISLLGQTQRKVVRLDRLTLQSVQPA